MLNYVVVQGRFAQPLELKNLPSGSVACSFSLACAGNGKNGAEKTDWIDCTAWGKKAEFITQYFNKGDMAIVSGRLTTSTYEKNGTKVKRTEIWVNDVEFCGGKVTEKTEGKKEKGQDFMQTEIRPVPPVPENIDENAGNTGNDWDGLPFTL